jgi:hypothetical protein
MSQAPLHALEVSDVDSGSDSEIQSIARGTSAISQPSASNNRLPDVETLT